MKPSTAFLLADFALSGALADKLRSWDQAGVSRRAAAALLTQELGGIQIAPNTVDRWTKQLAA